MKPERAELYCKTGITILAMAFAFALFWCKREGGAFYLGLISGSPAAAVGAAVAGRLRPGPSEATQTVTVNTGETPEAIAPQNGQGQ